MSTCDTCRKPGSCCSGFTLNRWYSAENWEAEATADMARHGLDYFKPVRPVAHQERDGSIGVFFDCQRLGTDGRCTQYKDRPDTCHRYQAASDALCAEYQYTLRGVPIRVEVRP